MPAEGGPATVDRTAGAALPVDSRLRARQQALHLVELRVGLLQFRRFASDHVKAIVVADRHLIGEPAQVPGQLGDPLCEITG